MVSMRACHRVSRQHRSAGVAIVGKTYLSWSRRIFCSPGPQGVLFTSASRGPPQSIPLHPAGPGSVATVGIPSSAVPATFFFFFSTDRHPPTLPFIASPLPSLPIHDPLSFKPSRRPPTPLAIFQRFRLVPIARIAHDLPPFFSTDRRPPTLSFITSSLPFLPINDPPPFTTSRRTGAPLANFSTIPARSDRVDRPRFAPICSFGQRIPCNFRWVFPLDCYAHV